MARRTEGRRRDVLWLDTLLAIDEAVLAAEKRVGDTQTTVAPSALGRATVARIRGSYVMGFTPTAAADSMRVGLGIIVATADAVTAGVASLPGPITDPDASWLWVVYEELRSGAATAQDLQSVTQAVRGVIDTKAMRRTGTNDNLIFIAEGFITGGTPTALVSGVARVLIQEG